MLHFAFFHLFWPLSTLRIFETMATRASYMIHHVISRDSSRDMTSPPINIKPQGVNVRAAVTEDGHAPLIVFPCIKYNYQCLRRHSPQNSQFWGLRYFHVLPAWFITWFVPWPIAAPIILANYNAAYSVQSRAASPLTSLQRTLRYASVRVQSSRRKGLPLSSSFPPKIHAKYIYQHARCHRPQKYTFFKFWGLCPIFGAYYSPILRPGTLANTHYNIHLISIFLLFTAFFTIMPKGLTTQVQSSCRADAGHN
jgi:hypothetical protein